MDLLSKLTEVIDEVDHDGFDNYVATTKHPGNVLFAIALCTSITSIIVMPTIIKFGRYLLGITQTPKEQTTTVDNAGKIIINQKLQLDGPPHDTSSIIEYLWKIVAFDDETRRIVRLAIPLICSANTKHATNLITLAIISHYLGAEAMMVYSMVHCMIEISSCFLLGWIETIDSIGSMAFGAGNNELCGRYVQTACISYALCAIPTAFFWSTTIEKIMLLLGFSKSVAELAQGFVLICLAYQTVEALSLGMQKFLAVIEKETYSNVMFCLSCVTRAALLALFATTMKAPSLNAFGVVILVNSVVSYLAGFIMIPIQMGWTDDFGKGLFGWCSNRWSVMKEVFVAACPLAFGRLMEEAEWEVLTLFAATMGPAEVATWATLAFIWDFFESTTMAIGDASEMRVAYQLGKGRPGMAKLAGYKAMYVAFITAVLGSAIFLSMKNVLPSLLTKDATIQFMLSDLFPIIALSNVSMTVGMVAWTVVGGQGRYDLATKIAVPCSFFVTFLIAGGKTYCQLLHSIK
jgi:MATE family multidrug resistance protein